MPWRQRRGHCPQRQIGRGIDPSLPQRIFESTGGDAGDARPREPPPDGDVRPLLATASQAFDLVLLDVDNGPEALTLDTNDQLYTPRGITAVRNALRPGGVAAVWSADHDVQFATRLQRGGFEVEVHQVSSRPGGKGDRHVIFTGRRA